MATRFDPRWCTTRGHSPNLNRPCRRFVVRAHKRGLVVTSTLRLPVSRTASYHQRRNRKGQGKGVDVSGPMSVMLAFQRAEFRAWKAGRRPNLQELIGPDNRCCVLSGRHVILAEGSFLENQHDTHCHFAGAKR
jgi:hypothetical protein